MSKLPPKRYQIIDCLRFVLALWVALGHMQPFPFFGHAAPGLSGILHSLDRALRTMVWGVPAVMAFFVISGFCIHVQCQQRSDLPVLRFYARRYTRIMVPVIGVVAILSWVQRPITLWGSDSILWHSTLWSLLCEEIYYAIYPFVRSARKRFGWTPILFISFLICGCIMVRFHAASDWNLMGPLATAFTLYPIWLAGCVLAEKAEGIAPTTTTVQIWLWRFGAWFGMWIAEMLNFHAGIFQTATMMPFGILTYFWIYQEIAYYKTRTPSKTLAWAGNWSYSLYLVHPIIVFSPIMARIDSSSRLGWLVILLAVLSTSYLFYLCVELPSHRLAKRIPLWPKQQPHVLETQPVTAG